MWQLTVSPEDAPNKPQFIEISFEAGTPVGIYGENLDAIELINSANEIGGKHGIGRVDMVENRLVGMKSRGAYETPGGTLLVQAHRELESICLDRETQRIKDILSITYADIVYNGQWFSALREALDQFVIKSQEHVTGTVRLKLFKGRSSVVGRSSPYSLYREDLATFSEGTTYRQQDAEGFINLFGLPAHIRALIKLNQKTSNSLSNQE